MGLDFGENKVSYLSVDALQKFLGDAVKALGGAVGGGEMEGQFAAGFGVDVVHFLCGLCEVLSDSEDSVATAATARKRESVVFPVKLALAEQAEATHRGVAIGIF